MVALRKLAGDRPTRTRARFAGSRILAVQRSEDRDALVAWRDPGARPDVLWLAPAGEGIVEVEPQPPDGARVALVGMTQAWLLDLGSGTAMPLGSVPERGTAIWSPDGARLAMARGVDGVEIFDVATGTIRRLAGSRRDADPHSWDREGLVLRETDPTGKFRATYYSSWGGSAEPQQIDGPRWQAPGGTRRVRYRYAAMRYEVERGDDCWYGIAVRTIGIGYPDRVAPWAGPDAWLVGEMLVDLATGRERRVLDAWAQLEDASPGGERWLFRLADDHLYLGHPPAPSAYVRIPEVPRAPNVTGAVRARPAHEGPLPAPAPPPRRGSKVVPLPLSPGGGSVTTWLVETIHSHEGETFARHPLASPAPARTIASPDGRTVAWSAQHVITPPRIHDRHALTHATLVVVHDTVSGALRALPHLGGVNDFAFSSDGKHLATASGVIHQPGEFDSWEPRPLDCHVRVWEVETGRLLRTTDLPWPATRDDLRRHGGRLDETPRAAARDAAHVQPIGRTRAIAFSPDGATLLGFAEHRTDVWAIADRRGRLARTWPLEGLGLGARGLPLAIRRDADRTVVVELDPVGGGERELLVLGRGTLVLARGGRFVACNWQNHAEIWDLEAGASAGSYGDCSVLALAPDGRSAVVSRALASQLLGLGAPYARAHLAPSQVLGAQFTTDGKLLVVPGPDHAVRVCDVGTGELRHELRGGGQPKHTVAIDEARGTIAANAIGAIARWSLADGRLLPAIPIEPGSPFWEPMAFSPDGTTLACGSYEGVVALCTVRE